MGALTLFGTTVANGSNRVEDATGGWVDPGAIVNPLDTISQTMGGALQSARDTAQQVKETAGAAVDAVRDTVADGLQTVRYGLVAYAIVGVGGALGLYFLLRGGVIAAFADLIRSTTSLFLGG